MPAVTHSLKLGRTTPADITAAQILEIAPHATVKDYEDMLARLNSLPRVIAQRMGA